MDAEWECLYHGDRWRSSVQFVANQMRGRLIPNKYMNLLGKLICVCRKQENGTQSNDVKDGCFDIQPPDELKTLFNVNIFNKTEHGLCATESVLKKMLSDISPTHSSRIRFLQIVLKAVRGDLSIFIMRNRSQFERPDNRQKYSFKEEFELQDMMPYAGHLFGKEGRHIKALCKKYNCEIHISFNSSITPEVLTAEKRQTLKVEVKTKTSNDLMEVQSELQELALLIIKKRNAHDSQVSNYIQRKTEQRRLRQLKKQDRDHKMTLKGSSGNSHGSFIRAADDIKENLRETFSVKQKHTTSARKKKPLGILEEGSRCVNCVKPYKKAALGKVECIYHPGFVKSNSDVRHFWSCCGEPLNTSSVEDQRASHEDSGCAVGNHNWRPTKRQGRQRVKSSNSLCQDLEFVMS